MKDRKLGKENVQRKEADKFCRFLQLWSLYIGAKSKCIIQDIN